MSILDILNKVANHLVKNETNIRRTFDYLNRYGYLSDKQEESIDNVIDTIKRLQRLGGIPETGQIDGKTLALMNAPRCACKDIEFITEDATRPNKWGLSTVNWYVAGWDTEVSKTDWIDTLEQSLYHWTEVCNIKFARVENIREANVVYDIGQGRKDDFDGSNGTLAWMQLCPAYNFKGQLIGKFDKDETWITKGKTGRGIHLLEVATHENGHHLIGTHSKRPNALMGPFYRQGLMKPQQDDDIPRAQALFGKPANTPTPKPTPTTPTQPPAEDDEIVIRLRGAGAKVSIDGYRISKLS